jgi:hypothetical protein
MASRDYTKHFVSKSAPPSSTLGDEWFNPSTNTLYKRVATNGTVATWLAAARTDIPNSNIVGTTDSQTLINKRITSRVSDPVTGGNYTLNSNNLDTIIVTPTLATNISVDLGDPTDGQKLLFRVYSAVSVSLNFATGTGTKGFRPVGVSVPGTTTAGKVMYIGCMYNANEIVWDIIAYNILT